MNETEEDDNNNNNNNDNDNDKKLQYNDLPGATVLGNSAEEASLRDSASHGEVSGGIGATGEGGATGDGGEIVQFNGIMAPGAIKSMLIRRLEREKLEEEQRRKQEKNGKDIGFFNSSSSGANSSNDTSDNNSSNSDNDGESNGRFSAMKRRLTTSAAVALAERRAAEYRRKNLDNKKIVVDVKRGTGKQQQVLGGKKNRQKDEFDEMSAMMSEVDSKIATIETNLASVLNSKVMQKHIPQSRKLINEVQAEYKRVEKMYRDSALAAIEA
ncbi:hypothetical protein HK100_010566, partial [Physocladia obscura]